MSDGEPEYIEVSVEKPKRVLSEKQKANLAKGREKKQKLIAEDMETKANRKLEERFDRLVSMFEKIQLPAPEVQERIKQKRTVKQPQPEPDEEEEADAPPPPVKQRIEKPRATVMVAPTKQISFSFR